MSQENVELARSIYAAWGRGDFSGTAWADPKIEYVIVDGVDRGSWIGPARMAKAMRNVLEPWEDARIEVDDCRALDEERVLVLNHLIGRGKTSGLEVGRMRRNGAAVLHVRDGRVARYLSYYDRARALADLGLPQEGAAAGLSE
jgi:ketosteroid isomerase-like protein